MHRGEQKLSIYPPQRRYSVKVKKRTGDLWVPIVGTMKSVGLEECVCFTEALKSPWKAQSN